MAGDPTKASLWLDADVYVGGVTAADPTTVDDEFGSDWDLVGLLDGDDGFTEVRNEDVGDHYAWGGIIVRTSRKHFKLQKKFTALENNDVTRDLIWPDSPPGQIVVPRPKRIKIAFETREEDVVHRLICAHEAEVAVDGDIKESEAELTKYALIATIFPTGDGVLFTEQATEVGS